MMGMTDYNQKWDCFGPKNPSNPATTRNKPECHR